jgi:hypothetical protein
MTRQLNPHNWQYRKRNRPLQLKDQTTQTPAVYCSCWRCRRSSSTAFWILLFFLGLMLILAYADTHGVAIWPRRASYRR